MLVERIKSGTQSGFRVFAILFLYNLIFLIQYLKKGCTCAVQYVILKQIFWPDMFELYEQEPDNLQFWSLFRICYLSCTDPDLQGQKKMRIRLRNTD